MAIQYDPNFTSGLEYALSVAGGQNVPNMIAPGVSYSSEFPMGYTADGLAPPPMPVPMPPPMPATLEDFQRVDPFAALNAQLSDSLANPTASMYGNNNNMGMNASMPMTDVNLISGFRDLNPFDYETALMDLGLGNQEILPPSPRDMGQSLLDSLTPEEMASAQANIEQAQADVAQDQYNAQLRQAGETRAFDNAMDTAGMARDKASAMNTLFGGAGSSFESGRNEYTESGQYDIDREARQAEFDAMRQQRRIDAGLPSIRLTPEETQQAVQELQANIGFGGAMTPRGRNRIPAMAAEPVPQPVKGYTPFDFANIQSILNNLG